jgi:hypothetical protein
MILAIFAPIYWYWWGAVAFFAATALLAAAVWVQDRVTGGMALRPGNPPAVTAEPVG